MTSPDQLALHGLPLNRLVPILEALLFAAQEPVTPARLAEAAGASEAAVLEGLAELRRQLNESRRGIELVEVAGGYRLFTRPEYAEYVQALLQPVRAYLSPATLETLAVIAYRQPVTRAEIEAIRGVQCDRALKNLLERELVREAGRKDAPGRPILYVTTQAFLEYFGLRSLADLPPPESFGGRQ